MTDVEVVVAALVAGTAAGASETATSVVRDSYTGLREMVRRRLASHGRDTTCLEQAPGEDSRRWAARMAEELCVCGSSLDEELIAAQKLRSQLGTTGKSAVIVQEARGMQVGDHNTQTNTFQ